MSNRPVTKIARKGFDARYCSDRELSFSSEWKTPKIFKQTSSSWTNTLGYVPMFMGFRQLNEDVPFTALMSSEEILGGYNTSCFTHANPTYIDSPDFYDGVVIDLNGDLYINPFHGYNWTDENEFAVLFLDSIYGDIPTTYPLKSGGVYLLGKGDIDVRTAFPADNSIDSRFDTLKIFKTGTLELEVPEKTFMESESYKTYTAEVEHNLGYAPMFLPQASVGWILNMQLEDTSFVVNDELGLLPGSRAGIDGAPVLDVYVDSNKLYLRLWRFAYSFGERYYNAVTITLYYTIFYNKINEEFDLISD